MGRNSIIASLLLLQKYLNILQTKPTSERLHIKKAPINTIHPFLGISVRNNRCFCHTSVCFSYGPNNCSVLRIPVYAYTVLTRTKKQLSQVHLHWQMFSFTLSRIFTLLNSPISTPLSIPKTGVGFALSHDPLNQLPDPAIHGTGKEGVPSCKRRGEALYTSKERPAATAGSGAVCLQALVHVSPATHSQDSRPIPPLPNTSPTWARDGSSALLTAGAERCCLPPAR